jgi:hypothetical protein
VVEPPFQTLPGGDHGPSDHRVSQAPDAHLRRSLLVIWDGLPGHHSTAVCEFVAAQGDGITLERLRGYAPDLNPV